MERLKTLVLAPKEMRESGESMWMIFPFLFFTGIVLACQAVGFIAVKLGLQEDRPYIA